MEPADARTAFSGALVRVEIERWPHGDREIVRHPGAAAVLALTPADEAVLVRQLREPVREALLEIPAGVLDVEGEDPTDAAARELEEETGYVVERMEPLGEILTSPGFTDERIVLFLARTAARPRERGEPGVDVVRMGFPEALEAVRSGRIRDAKTVVALLLATEHAERPSSRPGGGRRGSGLRDGLRAAPVE